MNNSYLGTSLRYPIKINSFGRVETVSGVEAIPESIEQILFTPIGTRFMLPEFGSNITTLIFEQNTDVLRSLMAFHVREALNKWEKRISVVYVDLVNIEPSKAQIFIQYENLTNNQIEETTLNFNREII